MKKAWYLLFACALCGAVILAACGNGGRENPTEELQTEVPSAVAPAAEVNQTDIEEKIIGKWIIADLNGRPALTNDKSVFTFPSTTKAYMSASFSSHPEQGIDWIDLLEADVVIEGNKITVTRQAGGNKTMVDELTVSSITAEETIGNLIVKSVENGTETILSEGPVRIIKVKDDLKEDIIGMWEGRSTSEGSPFDDGQIHRWEFSDDGEFTYFTKDGDNWMPDNDDLSEYIVDGNLFCSRWGSEGKENREWWEISIDGDTMKWTALREDGGTTFTATFEMKRVNE